MSTRSGWAERGRSARCSDVDLLGDGERIVNLDAEVPDGALHLHMPKEKLNRAEIPGPPVNQSGEGPMQRARSAVAPRRGGLRRSVAR
jgi:hypothetical protein